MMATLGFAIAGLQRCLDKVLLSHTQTLTSNTLHLQLSLGSPLPHMTFGGRSAVHSCPLLLSPQKREVTAPGLPFVAGNPPSLHTCHCLHACQHWLQQ